MSKRSRFTISLDPNLPVDLAIIKDIKALPPQSHRRAAYIRSLLVLGHQWTNGERDLIKSTILAGINDETRPFLTLILSLLESERAQLSEETKTTSSPVIGKNVDPFPVSDQPPSKTAHEHMAGNSEKSSNNKSSEESVSKTNTDSSQKPIFVNDLGTTKKGTSSSCNDGDVVENEKGCGQKDTSTDHYDDVKDSTSTSESVHEENTKDIQTKENLSLEDLDEPDALLLLQQKLT